MGNIHSTTVRQRRIAVGSRWSWNRMLARLVPLEIECVLFFITDQSSLSCAMMGSRWHFSAVPIALHLHHYLSFFCSWTIFNLSRRMFLCHRGEHRFVRRAAERIDERREAVVAGRRRRQERRHLAANDTAHQFRRWFRDVGAQRGACCCWHHHLPHLSAASPQKQNGITL